MKIMRQLFLNLELNMSFIADLETACRFLEDAWSSIEQDTFKSAGNTGFLNRQFFLKDRLI